MKPAQQFLTETIEAYNKNVSYVYQFKFNKTETDIFAQMMDNYANYRIGLLK